MCVLYLCSQRLRYTPKRRLFHNNKSHNNSNNNNNNNNKRRRKNLRRSREISRTRMKLLILVK